MPCGSGCGKKTGRPSRSTSGGGFGRVGVEIFDVGGDKQRDEILTLPIAVTIDVRPTTSGSLDEHRV